MLRGRRGRHISSPLHKSVLQYLPLSSQWKYALAFRLSWSAEEAVDGAHATFWLAKVTGEHWQAANVRLVVDDTNGMAFTEALS